MIWRRIEVQHAREAPGAFQFKSVSRSRLLVPNFSPPFELTPVVSLVGPAFILIVAYAQPTTGGGTESNL